MRRFLMLPLVFGLAFSTMTTSLAAESCPTGTPAANIAIAKKFYRSFNSGDTSLLNTVLTSNWVDVPLGPGQGPGRDGMKAAIRGYHATFSGLHATNKAFIVSGDTVVVRSMIHGTQTGTFAGVKPTGKPIDIMAVDIHQICSGRIVRTWHVENWLAALFQLGALPIK